MVKTENNILQCSTTDSRTALDRDRGGERNMSKMEGRMKIGRMNRREDRTGGEGERDRD